MRDDSVSAAGFQGSSWLFRFLIGATALFIAGCSAFFSVNGLGLLFVGSATAVMIMAASLELGKLIGASFLYRYWSQVGWALKFYLLIAVLVLIGVTSLGNYGYLARAYEQTNSQVALLEQQIVAIQKEVDDTQQRIDASRSQLGRTTDAGRQDIQTLQQRIAQANQSLDQSLPRLEERRKGLRDKRDRDIDLPKGRMGELAGMLQKSLDSEAAAIAGLNERIAALDAAVEVYTKQGGGGFLKADGVQKGQLLREQQQPERAALATEIASHQKKQEQFRSDHARRVDAIGQEIASIEAQYKQDIKGIDTEEQSLRKARAEAVASAETQLAALQSQGQSVAAQGGNAIESMYQRIRSGNEDIRHLREQIAATDIGSYRFVARAFNAGADDVVKWLILVLVVVFDPLAVALTVGFNVAMVHGRRPRRTAAGATDGYTADEMVVTGGRWWARLGLTAVMLLATAIVAAGAYYGAGQLRLQSQSSHSTLVPGDSFAVMTIRPAQLRQSVGQQKIAEVLGTIAGASVPAEFAQLLNSGIEGSDDVYAFLKYPTARAADAGGDHPVMLCGMVARVGDDRIAEAALSRFAETLMGRLSKSGSSVSKMRSMVRFGRGRYLDPQGGFFTFALTDHEAIVLMEIEGDPAHPGVESEIRQCLGGDASRTSSKPKLTLPKRAFAADGAMALWFDSGRCFAEMPKNPAAQARYQQLQRLLGFDVVLTVKADALGRLNLLADYNYAAQRFNNSEPGAMELLAKLGSAETAGIPGRLMDRCAVTLEFDSMIDRLKSILGKGSANRPAATVLVEKSIASDRSGRFLLTAEYDATAGPPLVAALESLAQ